MSKTQNVDKRGDTNGLKAGAEGKIRAQMAVMKEQIGQMESLLESTGSGQQSNANNEDSTQK